MSGAPLSGDRALSGPVAQSVAMGFVALRIATVLLALGWATMNVRQVPPEMQAVVMRLGAIDRVQQSGLVIAWPRPIERVLLVPGPVQQMSQRLAANTAGAPGLSNVVALSDAPATAGSFLTGDGGVVLLDATLTWRIVDAAAYVLAEQHIAPALRRAAEGAAVAIAAARPLDDFVVARPERADPRAQAAREALRAAFAAEVNRRLRALDASGAGLGIEVTRADVSAYLPASAKLAFDAVLNAGQMAEQGIAQARTGAEQARQAAAQESDRIVAAAQATAAEKIADAHAKTAEIASLAADNPPDTRPALIERLYRDRIVAILKGAGAVTAVDARGGTRVILPGSLQ
ncbi:MAG TPA: SPFH domain-containing protein [Acidisphaera sp.]|nr:SPFH domain-containing protein [Acidisphaera sp.]